MKKSKAFLAALAASLLFAGQAQADLIGTVTHDYGTGSYAPLGGSCDTLNADSVTVRNGSNCGRFYDAFDFSHLDYGSIDSFTLNVNFGDTADYQWLFIFLVSYEQWRVRPAASASDGSDINNSTVNINRVSGQGSNSYTFDSTLDVFDEILDGESFYLWFNHAGWNLFGTHSFNLYSASLDVYGTPSSTVPAPGVLGLLGMGLMGLGLRRRRRNG